MCKLRNLVKRDHRIPLEVAKPFGITVHGHFMVGRDGHASLKGLKLI